MQNLNRLENSLEFWNGPKSTSLKPSAQQDVDVDPVQNPGDYLAKTEIQMNRIKHVPMHRRKL
jgi:hypothetical protein